MSETTTMPFQPGTLAAEPVVGPEFDEETGNKRVLLVLAALGALAVLLIAGYFLLFSGGSDDKAVDAGAPAPLASTAPTTAPSTAPKTATLPKISARNFGTDPFKPLISANTAATGSTTVPSTTVPSTTVPTTTVPSTTVPPTTDPTTTTPAASKSFRFKVVKVSSDNSTISVTVNGNLHSDLKAGEVFAKIFKVRFIGGNVNAFQIGDEVFNVTGTKAVNISS